jgi:hypothetical protein
MSHFGFSRAVELGTILQDNAILKQISTWEPDISHISTYLYICEFFYADADVKYFFFAIPVAKRALYTLGEVDF